MARCDYAMGLTKMSEKYLDVSMDENSIVRYSNWNEEPLSGEQISYAEKKVRADIDLFKLFAGRIANNNSCRIKKVIEKCLDDVDKDFVDESLLN